MLQPFADEGLYWLNLFPPAERLISVVAFTGAIAASVVVGFLGCILVHSQVSRCDTCFSEESIALLHYGRPNSNMPGSLC